MAPWAFNPDRLTELADECASNYRTAMPFPHLVFDDILPEALLDELVADFPSVDDPGWRIHEEAVQRKQQWADAKRLPPVAASVVALFHTAPFLKFLERLTGTDGLIGDPYCHHGGLHQSMSGGFLKIHTDVPLQPALRLQRRVNMIVFLNRDWAPAWGGELELWDAEMTTCVERIEPRFNRMVVFDSVRSNHGHPRPTTSPPGVVRRSLALYYYISPTHPLAIPEAATTPVNWLRRPGEEFERPQPPASGTAPRQFHRLRQSLARAVRRNPRDHHQRRR
jgi:Rps23 Pro-64 3,4-dihydroxylase Tpa1-like proline 4-hydroxylase